MPTDPLKLVIVSDPSFDDLFHSAITVATTAVDMLFSNSEIEGRVRYNPPLTDEQCEALSLLDLMQLHEELIDLFSHDEASDRLDAANALLSRDKSSESLE